MGAARSDGAIAGPGRDLPSRDSRDSRAGRIFRSLMSSWVVVLAPRIPVVAEHGGIAGVLTFC